MYIFDEKLIIGIIKKTPFLNIIILSTQSF